MKVTVAQGINGILVPHRLEIEHQNVDEWHLIQALGEAADWAEFRHPIVTITPEEEPTLAAMFTAEDQLSKAASRADAYSGIFDRVRQEEAQGFHSVTAFEDEEARIAYGAIMWGINLLAKRGCANTDYLLGLIMYERPGQANGTR